MAVEGVSGEIATPAFMFLPCMVLMREMASAKHHSGVQLQGARERPWFCRQTHTLLQYGSSKVYHRHLRWHPPTGERVLVCLNRWELGGQHTCSGLETIMWQSIKMPGTPLATHSSTGAPVRGFKRSTNNPIGKRVWTYPS